MKPALLAGLALTAAGAGALACSSITATEEGVATLVIDRPEPALVEVGDTLQLRAEALDGNGEPVDVPITWFALDTNVVVDSATGRLTGRTPGQKGTVVARAGSLYSPKLVFTVLAHADSIRRVSPPADTVEATEDGSGDLVVRVEGGDPPAPVTGRRIVYRVSDPVFPDPANRTVELTGGGLVAVATTGAEGSPAFPVRLRRLSGQTPPDSAVVTAESWRPGGAPLPGSGIRFVIRFP